MNVATHYAFVIAGFRLLVAASILVPMPPDHRDSAPSAAAASAAGISPGASTNALVPSAPRFDSVRHAWMIGRFDDVQQALHDPCLGIVGAPSQPHREVRHAVRHELSPALVEQWRASCRASATELVHALPTSGTAELMQDFAAPFARRACSVVLQRTLDEVEEFVPLAQTIFLDAAHSATGAASATAQDCAVQLAVQLARQLSGALHGGTAGSSAANGIAAVQTFVALSHTVPALITASLLLLLEHPAELKWLRTNGLDALPVSAELELLRLASPSWALFREVRQQTHIGGVQLLAGSRAVLMTGAANRDPLRFPHPHRLDLRRTPTPNLALGSGVHGCAGAVLVRMLLGEAIRAVVVADASISHAARDVQWLDGFAMRAPQSLPVTWEKRER